MAMTISKSAQEAWDRAYQTFEKSEEPPQEDKLFHSTKKMGFYNILAAEFKPPDNAFFTPETVDEMLAGIDAKVFEKVVSMFGVKTPEPSSIDYETERRMVRARVKDLLGPEATDDHDTNMAKLAVQKRDEGFKRGEISVPPSFKYVFNKSHAVAYVESAAIEADYSNLPVEQLVDKFEEHVLATVDYSGVDALSKISDILTKESRKAMDLVWSAEVRNHAERIQQLGVLQDVSTPFKAGDVVQLKDCPDDERLWHVTGNLPLPVGSKLTVNHKYVKGLTIPCNYDKDGCTTLIMVDSTTIEPFAPQKCTCPPVNFYFNGIGCKCGGV